MKRLVFEQLLEWKSSTDRKPLVLRGARQVGKTWLIKEFGERAFPRVHYVNFEKMKPFRAVFDASLEPRKLIEQLSIMLDTEIDIGQDLLVFDEIQDCPNAITSLKYFNEDLGSMFVCCAGSHIGLTLNEGSFPVGNVDFIDLYPMSFEEFLLAGRSKLAQVVKQFTYGNDIPIALHDTLMQELQVYFVVGGMPEAVQAYWSEKSELVRTMHRVRSIQNSLLDGYRGDFSKHAGKLNASHLNMVFENIPEQLLRAMDGSVARYRFKNIVPNKSKFSQLEGPIDWLVKAGLAHKVSIVSKPEIPLKGYVKANRFKLFLFDIGLLGCMLDLPFETILNQDLGSYKGYLAENFVAQEFCASGCKQLYSWEGRQSEIEFIRELAGEVVPIEVKSGTRARSKSLSVYTEKFQPKRRIKLTARNIDFRTPNYQNYPLYLSGKIQ